MSTDYSIVQNTNNVQVAQTLAGFILNFKRNFLQTNIEIVPGLTFNQYETVKRVYFYMHNQFESGPYDELGQRKYFYDMMTDRNDQATKNIDLDTKDVYIKAENAGTYLLSWLLRQEFMGYAKTTGFGSKLNELSDDLPDVGTVVWKKVKADDGTTDVSQVELINILNDPTSKCLKDGIMIERHLLTQDELRKKGASINQDEVTRLIKSGKTAPPVPINGTMAMNYNTTVDRTTPYYEVYEMWAEIPLWLYKRYENYGKDYQANAGITSYQDIDSADANKSVYVMALVAGVEQGSDECVLFIKKTTKEMFPYMDVHYRRRKGRWLGLSNYELCFDQIEKANECTNRFFNALRISTSHLYQTTDKTHVKNVMTDMEDGDLVVTKAAITAIPTEIRGLAEYKDEMARIESRVEHICNAYEVVTGENLPSGTPFQLGAQMLASATKLFEYIRQNMGLFIEDVFNKWLLPDFAKGLTDEHILDLTNDPDDLKIYYDAIRKVVQYDLIKKYILTQGTYPSVEQLQLVGSLVKDQMAHAPKQVLVEQGTYPLTLKYGLKVITTGENEAKKQNIETLKTTLETVAANPQALQDPRFMMLLSMILEETGFSPLKLNALNTTPTNPDLNPANQGGNPGQQRSNITSSQVGAGMGNEVTPPTPTAS